MSFYKNALTDQITDFTQHVELLPNLDNLTILVYTQFILSHGGWGCNPAARPGGGGCYPIRASPYLRQ